MATISFDGMPDDMKVMLDDLIRMTVDRMGHSTENDNVVPDSFEVFDLPLAEIPVVELDEFERGTDYAMAMDPDVVPPILVAYGTFVDGKHRAFRARELGRETIRAIDLTGIADRTMIEANSMGRVGRSVEVDAGTDASAFSR